MDSRDAVIEQLRALVAKQAAQLEEQAARLEQQAARIKQLELALSKAKQDYSTFSKPSSSDMAKPKPKWEKARGRKKPRYGPQPGHQRQLPEPLPSERVDETIEYEIDDGQVPRLGLTPTGDFDVIQHIELPETPVHVTEHRLTVYQDADRQLYIPDYPEVKGPIFRTTVASDDRLAQVGRPLQLLDGRSVAGRRAAGARLARFSGEALHRHDLRFASGG